MSFKTLPYTGKEVGYTPEGGNYYSCPFCDKGNYSFDENYFSEPVKQFNRLNECTYCPNCKIFFDFCCKYAENGCSESSWYPKLMKLSRGSDVIFNPMIRENDIEKLKDFTITFECMCPGMCQHDPNAFYPEYNGLGLSCCKKISEEEQIKNETILETRMRERKLKDEQKYKEAEEKRRKNLIQR